jgi:hypothetical protein
MRSCMVIRACLMNRRMKISRMTMRKKFDV